MKPIRFLIIILIILAWLPLTAWALWGYSSIKMSLGIELVTISPFALAFIVGWIATGKSFNDFINS